MKIKNIVLLIFLGLANLVCGILLTVFVMPEKIPFLFDYSEKIISHCSKWFMLIASILPTIFVIVTLITKNKKLQFFMAMLFVLSLFENILYYSYFCLGTNLNVGEVSEIPISISIFMPLSVIITVCAIKLKTRPYLSKPAINFKVTRETEFIWKQTHFYAKDVYFITGLILFFISLIFSLIRYPLIELAIFIIGITISTLLIYLNSKSLYEKYIDMKIKQDNLKNKDSQKNANNVNLSQNNSKKSTKKKKNTKKIDPSKLM